MDKKYTAPEIRELGSLTELTQGMFNKVGSESDILTALTGGIVIGSFVPTP